MYKIGQFSKITGLSIKTLRYYDKEGILIPAQRLSDNAYRLYDEENFNKANMIIQLRKLNFGISEIKDVLEICEDDHDLFYILKEKKLQVEAEIMQQQSLLKEISALIKPIQKEEFTVNYEIEIIEIPQIRVASVRFSGQYSDVGCYIGKIYKAIKGKGNGTSFCCYYDMEYKEIADIEVCVPIKDTSNLTSAVCKIFPKIRAITTIHYGSYTELAHAYKALFNYAYENDLKLRTPIREMHVKGPGMMFAGNPDKYVTKIIIPFERKDKL